MLLESFHLKSADAAALAFFVAAWVVFAFAAAGRLSRRTTLTQAMNRQREEWMRTMALRELRMIDTGIMAGLQQGTAFFASSSIFAIGGCLALLGASDQVMTVLGDLPFGTITSRAEFELKVLGLAVILSYSFFKFGWAYRLFNYCSILIGAVPVIKDDSRDAHDTARAIARAARMNILAGGHFNAGLRGIFFSLGYLGWFIGPAIFAATTIFVFVVLLRRQFFSAARAAVVD